MFIELLTKKIVQIINFVIKTDNTFIIFTFLEKYRKRTRQKIMTCSRLLKIGCNNIVLPILFIVVNDIVQYC